MEAIPVQLLGCDCHLDEALPSVLANERGDLHGLTATGDCVGSYRFACCGVMLPARIIPVETLARPQISTRENPYITQLGTMYSLQSTAM